MESQHDQHRLQSSKCRQLKLARPELRPLFSTPAKPSKGSPTSRTYATTKLRFVCGIVPSSLAEWNLNAPEFFEQITPKLRKSDIQSDFLLFRKLESCSPRMRLHYAEETIRPVDGKRRRSDPPATCATDASRFAQPLKPSASSWSELLALPRRTHLPAEASERPNGSSCR